MLIDELMERPWFPMIPAECLSPAAIAAWPAHMQGYRSLLRDAVPFVITNVARYLYLGTQQEVWNLFEDFPGFIPPFDKLWMEWEPPLISNSGGNIGALDAGEMFKTIGCLIASEDRGGDLLINVMGFSESRRGVLFQGAINCFLARKEDGEIHSVIGGTKVGYVIPGVDPKYMNGVAPELKEELTSSYNALMFPACLAISLLNCRNVSTVNQKNHRQQIRHAQRHGRHITQSFRVIEIQPIIKHLESATGQSGYAREAAAIIRGHFKDYTHGGGLFGKYKGRFWWHQRVSPGANTQYGLAKAGRELSKEWTQ